MIQCWNMIKVTVSMYEKVTYQVTVFLIRLATFSSTQFLANYRKLYMYYTVYHWLFCTLLREWDTNNKWFSKEEWRRWKWVRGNERKLWYRFPVLLDKQVQHSNSINTFDVTMFTHTVIQISGYTVALERTSYI